MIICVYSIHVFASLPCTHAGRRARAPLSQNTKKKSYGIGLRHTFLPHHAVLVGWCNNAIELACCVCTASTQFKLIVVKQRNDIRQLSNTWARILLGDINTASILIHTCTHGAYIGVHNLRCLHVFQRFADWATSSCIHALVHLAAWEITPRHHMYTYIFIWRLKHIHISPLLYGACRCRWSPF